MAVAVKPSQSLINIRSNIKSVKDSFSSINKKTGNVNNILLKKTKVKRESIARNYVLSQRRQEAERRKNREDLIEASSVGGVIKSQAKAVASSSKGFLGRIMDFLGTLLVGWLAYNLPSIITMAQELIARMQRLATIVSGFFNNTTNILKGFGNLLGAVSKNILTFDFTDSSGRVKSAMSDLGSNFDDMQSQFDEGFRLLTTSLDQGLVTGKDAEPFGTEYPNQSMQEPSGAPAPTPSGGGGGGGQWKPVLDLISQAESAGGSYDSRYGGIYPGYSKLTIAEADKVQRTNYKKWGSAASGRYQFMNIAGQAADAGLKPTDLFSPANQDKMAISLIEKKRKITIDMIKNDPRKAQLKLAQEWAGIPTSSGKSFYPPPNYATVTNDQVQKAFAKVGKPPAQTTSTPAQAPTAINPNKKIALNAKVGSTVKTDYFGSMGVGRKTPHGGIDLGCDVGTYISCKYPCRVVEASSQSGYGYYTDIIIPSLNIRLRFAHLSKQLIKSGDVPAGKPFAQSGNSGAKTTGPHIHMEATKNMNGTAYGGDFNPDPYVDAMIFSKNPPAGFVAPSTPSTPAQIASQGTQQRQQVSQQLAQQRNGPTVVVMEEEPPPQQQVSAGGGGGGIIPIIINPLNSFITKKLLLDLAYT